MSYAPGTVLRLEFQNSDGTLKQRPVAVVSNNTYNDQGRDITVVEITSNLQRNESEDVVFSDSHPEFRRSGLSRTSVIRCGKVQTFDVQFARATKIGALGDKIFREVVSGLHQSLAFTCKGGGALPTKK